MLFFRITNNGFRKLIWVFEKVCLSTLPKKNDLLNKQNHNT